MPDMSPITKPVKPRKPTPKRLSSQRPAKPGKTITAATARILETQVMASETGDGSFEEFTGEPPAVKSIAA
jgi:hypothetical protein